MRNKLWLTLLGLILTSTVNAQFGIRLTDMEAAPDSGYVIVTTGDEYPERGLQKYVKAADVLGLDTMFQNGDSLCLLFRHESEYRCFPVHREVRFEKVDEGLRVCWEQRDTVWDTRAYLHFPGTVGSYVRARDIHDFEIDTNDVEIEISFRTHENKVNGLANSAGSRSVSPSAPYEGWFFRTHANTNIEFSLIDQVSISTVYGGPRIKTEAWHKVKGIYDFSTTHQSIEWNSNKESEITFVPNNERIKNYSPMALGATRLGIDHLHGDIRHFRFNDEYILFDESYGKDTLITNKGTVLDILGDVEWRLDTLGFTSIDTSHHCQIIPLTDKHLINVEHIGDSVRYTLSDSTIFTVRDSFLTAGEIAKIARDSVIVPEIPTLTPDQIVFGGQSGEHDQSPNLKWVGDSLYVNGQVRLRKKIYDSTNDDGTGIPRPVLSTDGSGVIWVDGAGMDGKEVQMRISGGYIQWRLEGGIWENLIALEDLKGADGEDGAGIEIAGSVDDCQDLPGNLGPGDAGQGYLVKADGKLYIWDGSDFPDCGDGVEFRGPQGPQGIQGEAGEDGEDGREVTLRVANDYIQWQYVGAPTWTNLIAIEDLMGEDGEDGRPVEMRGNGSVIEWRLEGDQSWNALLDIEDYLVRVDTFYRDGDSLYLVLDDGKTWAVRDSFKTDQDILDLIDMMYDPQWLTIDRDGNEITIGITDGNEVSFIDSVRTDADIAKVMLDSIVFPETPIPNLQEVTDVGNITNNWIQKNTSVRTTINVAEASSTSPQRIAVVKFPRGRYMLQGQISFRSYHDVFDIFFGGYTYFDNPAGDQWFQPRLGVVGRKRPEVPIRFATYGNDNERCIVIGDGSVSFSYPAIQLTKLMQFYGNMNPDDIEVFFTDTDTMFHNIIEPPMNEGISVSLLDGKPGDHYIQEIFKFGDSIRLSETGYYVLDNRLDKIYRDGDSIIYETLDGQRFASFDSTRTNLEIAQIARDSVDIPETDLSGIRDTLSSHDARLLSLEYFRDTLGIPDIASFTHTGDSIRLTMEDGRSWVVPDKHFTEQDIKDLIAQESPVNRSWLLKDGGVPDNASDTVYREGVAVIEGDIERHIYNGGDKYLVDDFVTVSPQALVDGSEAIKAIQQMAVLPNGNSFIAFGAISDLNQTAIGVYSEDGVQIYPYGSGQFEATPTYLLGVDAYGYIKEIRPTSGIDTIYHTGDSIFFDFGDKQFYVRDSVLSKDQVLEWISEEAPGTDLSHTQNGEQITVNSSTGQGTTINIADADNDPTNELQTLVRNGKFITLTDGGQVLDLYLESITHTGDSVRFTMSDGRTMTVRDSAMTEAQVKTWIDEGIPDTVFFVETDGLQVPVRWKDVVEIDGGQINLNIPTEIFYDSLLNRMVVCRAEIREIPNTVNGIHFGTTGKAEARSVSDVPLDFPVRLKGVFSTTSSSFYLMARGPNNQANSYDIRNFNAVGGGFGMKIGTTNGYSSSSDIAIGYFEYEATESGGTVSQNLNGKPYGNFSPSMPSGDPNSVFTLGDGPINNNHFNDGILYEVRVGSEVFSFPEGSGTTTESNQGTILDLSGDYAWITDTIGISYDTVQICDTFYLNDIFADTITYVNDTLYINLNDGTVLTAEIVSSKSGVDTMFSTSDSLYLELSDGRILSAGVAKGDKGDTGDGLDFDWDGTRLGVKKESEQNYDYTDLKGDTGSKGDTGDGFTGGSYNPADGKVTFTSDDGLGFSTGDLRGEDGADGEDGKSIEYDWDGTELGIRQEGEPSFSYTDLKGDKGEDAVLPDTVMYVKTPVVTSVIHWRDTIEIDGSTIILPDETGLAYLPDSNQLVFSKYDADAQEWSHDTIQLKGNIYTEDGDIEEERNVGVKDKLNFNTMPGNGVFNIWGDANDPLFRIEGAPRTLRMQTTNDVDRDASMNIQPAGVQIWSKYEGDEVSLSTIGGFLTMEIPQSPFNTMKPGKSYWLRKAGGGTYLVYDTLTITDIGISPADTTRWSQGGSSYELSRTFGRINLLENGSAASSVLLRGTDGISVGQSGSDEIVISGSGVSGDAYGLTRSGTSVLLQKNGSSNSSVAFSGGSGISLSGSGSTITINNTAPNTNQTLSHNTLTQTTTLSGGGGSFRLIGGNNVTITNTAGGAYTIDAGGGIIQDLYRSGADIGLSASQYVITDRYVSGSSKSGNNVTLNRTDNLSGITFSIADGDSDATNEIQTFSHNTSTQTTTLSRSGGSFRLVGGTNVTISNTAGGVYTINASGGSSPWTVSGSGIYSNTAVTMGGTAVASGVTRNYNTFEQRGGEMRFYDGSTLRGQVFANNVGINIRASSGNEVWVGGMSNPTYILGNVTEINGATAVKMETNNVRYKTESRNSGTASATVIQTSGGSITLPTSGMVNGTIKYVVNTSSSVIATVNVGGGSSVTVGTTRMFIYWGGVWY